MLNKIIAFFISLYVGSLVLSEIANPYYSGEGLIGWTVEEQEQPSHRQTYAEYVDERLQVERMLR